MKNMNKNNLPPRRSMHLATIIPASHWISLGYSNEDAQLMEKLQNDIKKYCNGGGDETSLTILGQYYSFNPIPHHDMLLPHWQKFAKCLNGCTSLVDLQITTISLPASVLDILFPVLQSMNLSNLELSGMDYDGIMMDYCA